MRPFEAPQFGLTFVDGVVVMFAKLSPVIVQPLDVVRVFRSPTAFALYILPFAPKLLPGGVIGLAAQPCRVAE